MVHLKQLKQRLADARREPEYDSLLHWAQLLREYACADRSICKPLDQISVKSLGVFGDLACEWHCAPNSKPTNRILFIHGGWNATDITGYQAFIGRLSEVTQCSVLAVEYRRGVKHPHPEALADCVAAYSVMLIRGPNRKDSARHIFILGDGTGATLALSTTLSLKERGLRLPDGVIALSPVTDWSFDTLTWNKLATLDPFLSVEFLNQCKKNYLGEKASPEDSAVSPLRADFKGFPPLFLQAGGCELLLDDAVRLSEKARAAGVDVRLNVYSDMPHAFQLFTPFLPEAVESMGRIADFTKCCIQQRVGQADVIPLDPYVQ